MPKPCKACGKFIDFIRTRNGKLMPVDVDEVTIVTKEEGAVVRGHVAHWQTCTSPDQFRKRDKEQARADRAHIYNQHRQHKRGGCGY